MSRFSALLKHTVEIDKDEDEEVIAKRNMFKESNITSADYIKLRSNFTCFEQHMEMIPKFIALLGNDYVVRESDNTLGVSLPRYKVYNLHQLAQSNINASISYEIEQAVRSKSGAVKSALVNIKVRPYEWLTDVEFQKNMAYFDDISLVSSSSRTLQSFIPPSLDHVPDELKPMMYELAESIVGMFTDLVDPDCMPSWEEELNSIAYKVQNPSEFVCKFFVHYGDGDNGKSLWCKFLSMMFIGCSNIGISDEQADGKFTGYLENYLLEWFEEIENENYQNQKFEKFIKRITTETVSFEKKGVDPHAGFFKALVGMNTNQPDLYGLVRAEKATKSRLVVIYFSKGMPQEEWQRRLEEFGVNRGNKNKYYNQYTIGASLWEYFKNRKIPSTFYPDRYCGEDKDRLFERLRSVKICGPDRFLCWLGDPSRIDSGFRSIVGRKGDRQGKNYVQISKKQVMTMFDQYIKGTKGLQSKVTFDTVTKRMNEIGFQLMLVNKTYTFDIEKQLWDKYITNYMPKVVAVLDDDIKDTTSSLSLEDYTPDDDA